MGIEFKSVEKEEIPRRGKYREQVKQIVAKFLKSQDHAMRSNEFSDRDLAMSYYDSFKDHVKKQDLPVEVKIRKNNDGTAWTLFLVKQEALA